MAASVLTYDETTKSWQPRNISLQNGNPSFDEICYIFLEDGDFYRNRCSTEQHLTILAPFDVPDFLGNQLCTYMNGYFGCRSTLENNKLSALSSWAKILTKKVLKPEERKSGNGKDYVWYEIAFFMRWRHPGISQILCIDTPPEVRTGLAQALTSATLELRDPFAMLRPLLDEVLKLCDENTWRVVKEIRRIEKSRTERPHFEELCNLHRHARHLVEVETVAIETMERLLTWEQANFDALPEPLNETYRQQAIEKLGFQLQIMKSLKWRAQASSERLDSEVNLAYNMLARMDNQIMKSITLLTMIFLPATFIATLFSTTFFAFDKTTWDVSPQFWIYWAVVVPLTIIVVVVWWLWLGGSYKSMRSKLVY